MPKSVFIHDYPENPKTFGEELRKQRYDLGLQIKEVAKVVGINEMTLINWELRNMTPSRKLYNRLMDYYVSISKSINKQ